MGQLWIDNYVINTPLIDILEHLKVVLSNGKLKDIEPSTDGTDIKITCPNDDHAGGREHSPDCHINLKQTNKLPYGWFHCFACDSKGPFIKFVALAFSRSEEYAKQWLIENYGERAYDRISIGETINFGNTRKPRSKYLDKNLLEQYQSWHPYLATRKLSREICEMFQVKYDPIYRQVIFPCFDINGGLLMLPKRSIDTKIFYLDKEQEKPVYCLDFIVKNNIKTAIVTEGPIDALTAYQYGFPAIATLGNLSDEQIDKINGSCLENIYMMFDNDEAGKKFATRFRKRATKRIFLTPVKLPDGKKDINDLSYQEFWNCLKNAKNLGKINV